MATNDEKKFTYADYQQSDVVTKAQEALSQQLANKPGEYQSQWQAQLNDTVNKILNREKFSYDLNGDALYQQYKDQYTTQGKMAMMDTMGQAQAMTGGYGNSYAQSVGQQTYQGYLQQLNDKVPELYQLALDQYNREEDKLYNQASLMAGMEEKDYGRYRDGVSDYYTELSRLTDDARYQGEQDYGRWADKLNLDYGMYRDQIADSQWQAQFDEAKRQYDQQYALQNSSSSSSSSSSTRSTGGDTPGDGGYDNAGLGESAVKRLQEHLGVTADGKWGPKSQAAAKAKYGITNAAELYKKLHGVKVQNEQKSIYADWDQGDWENYFSRIRQSEGQAAAEEELKLFTSKGYIPNNMVSYAALGARGGKMGH